MSVKQVNPGADVIGAKSVETSTNQGEEESGEEE